jgi:hypothetical protein
MVGEQCSFLAVLIFTLYQLAASGAIDGLCAANAAKTDPTRDAVSVDVQFQHRDNRLAGTLTLPKGPGPHPAVVMVLGSGEQDRVYGGVIPALARHFARHGFATLAWDKPGVGKSTGDFNKQSFRDRADEALLAIEFLRARDDIRPTQVGLWGHSQGGMVAPLAASLSRNVAFILEVAGWQGPAWKQDPVRVEAELRADGFPEADITEAVAFSTERMDLIRGIDPFEDFDRKQKAVSTKAWFKSLHYCDRALFEAARNYVDFDNGPCWEKVQCPVLVIFGDKDTSSGPAEPLIAIIRRGLTRAGNSDVAVEIFPRADHSLCKGKDRASGPDFVDGYLETMTGWLEKRCKPE